MTGAAKHAARLECRQCHFTLGRLSRDRRHPDFTPGLSLIVNLTMQRIEVICPRCSTRRSFTDVVFPAMVIPALPVDAA